MAHKTTHTPAGAGPHHLMLGTMVVSRLLGGDHTGGQFALVELSGPPGTGPGPHIDPWTESFYVLEGELEFRYEEDGEVRTRTAGPGDAFTIPTGVGHAFSVSGGGPARFLILGTPAGIEAFFADAGEPLERAEVPSEPPAFDRERLLAAFERHELSSSYAFPSG